MSSMPEDKDIEEILAAQQTEWTDAPVKAGGFTHIPDDTYIGKLQFALVERAKKSGRKGDDQSSPCLPRLWCWIHECLASLSRRHVGSESSTE